ncbi:hypothetical protein ACM9HF_16630 [Colwellia sp. RE-S-Sl-9]
MKLKLFQYMLIVLITISSINLANASLLTWDFTSVVKCIIQDGSNKIDGSITGGSTLFESIPYDSRFMKYSPRIYYSDPIGTFTLSGLGLYSWNADVSVLYNRDGDIYDVNRDYYLSEIRESIEISFLDYSQSYVDGLLTENWYIPPLEFSNIVFDYTLKLDTSPCCKDSRLQGDIELHTSPSPNNSPEPFKLAVFAVGLMGMGLHRIKKR